MEVSEINSSRNSHRFAAVASLATLFTYAVVLTVPQASVNQLGQAFHVSNTSLGVLFRLFMFGFLIAAIIGGRLSDKHGKLPVMVIGSLLMTAGMIIYFRASVFTTLYLAAILGGMGGGLAEIVAMATISDIYRGPRSTAMMNWSQVVFCAGAVAQPLVFAQLLKMGMNWRNAYMGAAGLSIACALITFAAAFKNKTAATNLEKEQGSWKDVLSNRMVIRLSVGLAFYVCAELGLASWVADYLKTALASSAPMAASSVAVFWAAVGLGRITATHLSRFVSDKALICWSLALGSLFLVALIMMHTPAAALILTACVGFCFGPIWPTIIGVAGDVMPTQSGTVIGIVAACACIGGAVGPSAVGWASDLIGIRMALWICFGALLLGLATMLPGKKN